MTCSVGIACNRMLAKICSELDKPNGQTYLAFDTDKIVQFMAERKARDIPGVGSVLEQILAGLNVTTCKEIYEHATEIYLSLTELQFEFLVKASLGISRQMHDESAGNVAKRSISISKSFKVISRKEQYMQRIEEMVDTLVVKVNNQQIMAKTLCLEFKSQEFEAKSRNISLPYYISHKDDLMKAFGDMLTAAWPLEPTRMLKLTLQNMRLRTDRDPKTSVMNQTLDLKDYFTKGPVPVSDAGCDNTIIDETEDTPKVTASQIASLDHQ